MGRIHRYKGKDIIVEFELARCIHTGDCTRDLPQVFDTKRSGPWVKPDAAPKEDIINICANCPSGALRARDPESGKLLHPAPERNTVRLRPNGPLYFHASMIVEGEAFPAYRAAFCRCGQSQRMPFCDESHRSADFTDTGFVDAPMPAGPSEDARAPLLITAKKGGPLIVEGPFTLIDANGKEVSRAEKAFFCRCGASNMKPYCDGAHKHTGFEIEASSADSLPPNRR